MSELKKNQVGSLNALLIPLILASLLFVVSLGFGIWAYLGMQDYKNNVDQKVDSAVKVAVAKNSSEKDNEFLEKEKQPNETYKGSDVLGAITFNYPKTWSGYFKSTDKDMTLMLQKGLVDGSNVSSNGTSAPIVVQVINSGYTDNLSSYESAVKTGKAKSSAFRLAKLQTVLGTKVEGQLSDGVTGEVVLLPMREKTIKISSTVQDYIPDLNNIVLPSFSFTP